jgi:hypothetical protein
MHAERLHGLYSSSDVIRMGNGEENIVWPNSAWMGKLYVHIHVYIEID